ncbi:MAG TPA: YfaZ family outer membrane protein [Steroidobacteraceae bacterium]|nr:YfaZ family outer membrane protein [Steroidobacteraceae bacterium]
MEGTLGNSIMQLRYLAPSPLTQARSDLDYGFLLSEDRDVIGSAALLFRTDLNLIPRLTFQLGPQAYVALLAAEQKTDVFALAFGGTARYDLIPSVGLAVFGGAFYSPGVVTFGNAHNLYDFSAGAELRFTRQLTGLGGYRWLKFTLVDEPDDRVQNEAFAGLRWSFD